ncbi:lytic transglycosylase domain-containing protein [Bosea sp. 2KB_26]|uniref:lytic transglycosylase domain-containing protein n=1 Tax=Bosea sp. 2KB_26 TaxID=3237475 RepID=UPI000DE1C022
MKYTSSGAAAALVICLASLQSAKAATNSESDALAFIVRDAEIKREASAQEAGSATSKAAASAPAERGNRSKAGAHRRAALAAPAGADGLKAIVARHAAANGVPFALADAVVRIESRYNPRASNAGNLGLMQIRHQTARGMGYTGSASGLLDAETNARYAVKYLAEAYRLAGGDTCRTVMKYQSGHMAQRMSGANRTYCAKVRTISAQN